MNLSIYFYSGWSPMGIMEMLKILLIILPKARGGSLPAHTDKARPTFRYGYRDTRSPLIRMASDEYG